MGTLLLLSFSPGPKQPQYSRRSSRAGDGAGLVPAGAEDGSKHNTGIRQPASVSELVPVPVVMQKRSCLAEYLGIRGIQSWAGHAGTAQDSDTAVARTQCLGLPSPPRDLIRICGKPELLQLLETPRFWPKPLNSKKHCEASPETCCNSARAARCEIPGSSCLPVSQQS